MNKILYNDLYFEIFNHLPVAELLNLKFVDKKIYEIVKIYLSNKQVMQSDKVEYTLNTLKKFYDDEFVTHKHCHFKIKKKILKWFDQKIDWSHPIIQLGFASERKYGQAMLYTDIKELEKLHFFFLKNEEIVQKAWQVVYEIFGGEKNFKNLPILDLSPICPQAKNNQYRRIDFIQPENMTSPIMRGIDLFGRHFFAVLIHETTSVKVFYQNINGKDWMDYSADESNVFFGGLWILDGNPQSVFIEFVKTYVNQAKLTSILQLNP